MLLWRGERDVKLGDWQHKNRAVIIITMGCAGSTLATVPLASAVAISSNAKPVSAPVAQSVVSYPPGPSGMDNPVRRTHLAQDEIPLPPYGLMPNPRSLPLLYRAVNFRWLNLFMQHEKAGDWSSADIVTKYVIPRTQQHQCSLAELLPDKHVGKADYFISYSWNAQSLSELIENIKKLLVRLEPEQHKWGYMKPGSLFPSCHHT